MQQVPLEHATQTLCMWLWDMVCYYRSDWPDFEVNPLCTVYHTPMHVCNVRIQTLLPLSRSHGHTTVGTTCGHNREGKGDSVMLHLLTTEATSSRLTMCACGYLCQSNMHYQCTFCVYDFMCSNVINSWHKLQLLDTSDNNYKAAASYSCAESRVVNPSNYWPYNLRSLQCNYHSGRYISHRGQSSPVLRCIIMYHTTYVFNVPCWVQGPPLNETRTDTLCVHTRVRSSPEPGSGREWYRVTSEKTCYYL